MPYRTTPLALGAFGAALSVMIASPLAADVKRGVDAWSAGDYASAVSEWQLPAQQGDADALFNLGQAYRLGRGVPADIGRARELYAEAAQKGHVKAADNYGLLLFQQGEQSKAMPLIREASDRGDPRAQYVLGLAHFNADYAEKDWVRAYALLTLSQSAGLPQASGALKQMDTYVPLAQRQEAQTLARSLEAEANKRRAAQLAAADLSQRSPAPTSSTSQQQPARTAQAVPMPIQTTPVAQSRATAPVRVATNATAAPVTPTVAIPTPAPTPTPVPASARPAPVVAAAPAAKDGDWGVQLGAFGVAANAERLWAKLSTNPALAGTQKRLVPGGSVTRLRAVGYATRSEASRACAQLSQQGQACIVAKPSA